MSDDTGKKRWVNFEMEPMPSILMVFGLVIVVIGLFSAGDKNGVGIMAMGPGMGLCITAVALDAVMKCAKYLKRLVELREEEAKSKKLAAAKPKW